MYQIQSQSPALVREQKYPYWGIILVLALNFLSPFVTSLLVYPAFLICVYRVIRYDEKIFATDYALLITVSLLFCTEGGMSLLVYLCLFADVWYFIKRGIRAETAVVGLLLLLNYMILRMQMNITAFLLCFGQLFLLRVLIPEQDGHSSERCVKAFCVGILVSSAYAMVFRNTWQLTAIRGVEVPAYWGSSVIRFYGLYQDPNYYSMMLITAMAVLIKLKDCAMVGWVSFIAAELLLIVCGVLTYSKTFFLLLVLLVFIYLVWQFWNKRVLRGVLMTVCVVIFGGILLLSEGSPFAVVLTRFTSATNISDLTTNRSELFMMYYNAITEDVWSLLFGKGLAASNLGLDPHNFYLEITYYLGLAGLVLIIAYCGILIHTATVRNKTRGKQNVVAKYAVVLIVLLLLFTLHGMTVLVTYAVVLIAALSMLLTKKEKEDTPCQSC